MNALQRAARAALQCCCRSLHSQVNAFPNVPDGAGALSILQVSSKVLRDAVAAEGPSSPADKGPLAGAVLPQACFAASAGQIAALLRMSKLHRASAEGDQTIWKPLHSFVEQSGAGAMYADSVRRKRKTKMNKHKHRKRLKKMRHGSK